MGAWGRTGAAQRFFSMCESLHVVMYAMRATTAQASDCAAAYAVTTLLARAAKLRTLQVPAAGSTAAAVILLPSPTIQPTKKKEAFIARTSTVQNEGSVASLPSMLYE